MTSNNNIVVSEVGPRDGLQIEAAQISIADKIRFIDGLSKTGLTRIEATAFVHPKVVPQMADANEVLAGIERRDGVRIAALVPNAKGAERALAAGVDDFKMGIAASDTFNELNIRMSTAEGMRALEQIEAARAGSNVRILGVVATAFGCPYEGDVADDDVFRLFEQLASFDAQVIYLADTTGMADPARIRRLVETLSARYPDQSIGLHLHNTRGLGLANALAGLDAGIRDFESSIGGLGGCPFAPRAVGNICTEDFVHMAERMGFDTGIDLDALIGCAEAAERIVGRKLPGMVMKAGKASTRFEVHAERIKVD